MLKRINAWDVEKHCRIDEWVDGNRIVRLNELNTKDTIEDKIYYYQFIEVHLVNGDTLLHPIANGRRYKDEVEALLKYFGLDGESDSYEGVRRNSDL